MTLGWAHGWIVRLTGLAIGSAVGVLAAVVLTNMLDTGGSGSSARRTWQVYVYLRVATCPETSPWFGRLLYVVQVAAIVLTTKFATTSLWSLGLIVMGSAIRFRRNPRERSAGRD